jgi:hypothetical protein
MLSKFLLTLLTLSVATIALLIARIVLDANSTGTLFRFPTFPRINLSFTLFNDEVFDISSISFFGDINDGSSSEAATTPESDTAAGVQLPGSSMFGQIPWSWPWPLAEPSTNIEVVVFNDEVFDISSISVFGNINDGASPEAEAEVAA